MEYRRRHYVDKVKGSDASQILYKEVFASDKGIVSSCRDFDVVERHITLTDTAKLKESRKFDIYNYVSYTGKFLVKPACTVLFYGERIYFKDLKELAEFNSERFRERFHDRCPVCGNFRGRHLKYCFADGSGIPFEIFPCSRECLRELTHKINFYRPMLKELQQLPDRHEYPWMGNV